MEGRTDSWGFKVENGTLQGSVISLLLFSIMTDDIYSNINVNISRSLFADDGALWTRATNTEQTVKRL